MTYNSQFRKIDPYDWFCAPGSHIEYIKREMFSQLFFQLLLFPANLLMCKYLFKNKTFQTTET